MKETKFKQTEVGMIPSDWECVSFNKVFVKLKSRNHQINSDEYLIIGKYPVVDQGQEPIVAYTNKNNPMEVPSSGLIVFGDHTRIFKYVDFDFFVGADGTQLITCLEGLNTKFLFYQCLCLDIPNTGYNRHFKYLKESLFVIPSSKEEQQRIANALSDVDTLINNLEKLIAKKKNIKQGAMQQLLIGKKRLPGFAPDERRKECHSERSAKREESSGYKMTELGLIPSDWEVKTFGDVGKGFSAGATPYRQVDRYYEGDIKWVSSGELDYNVIQETQEHISIEAVKATNLTLHPKNTFLMAITGLEAAGTRGRCAILGCEATTNQSCLAIYESEYLSIPYLYHFYVKYGDALAFAYAQGSKQQSFTAAIVKKLPIILPSSKAEQTAIANVLSDMDTEISALETKLAKYRTLKTGMMQQLLTGKIRLIDAKPETASVENNRVVPVAFKRAVLAAEIAHRLCAEPTFGHIKMEKMLFLAEKMCELDINSSYHRDAAGPYDNRALRSVDSQLEKQKWFKFIRSDKGNHYIPLEKRGGHSQYFDRYYSECRSVFDNIISTFKTAKTEQCEIVATLYSAWEDFLNQGANPTDDQIVTEVLTNWNESKKRISKERWIKALLWMKENKYKPRR